jgi:hypothetical protein
MSEHDFRVGPKPWPMKKIEYKLGPIEPISGCDNCELLSAARAEADALWWFIRSIDSPRTFFELCTKLNIDHCGICWRDQDELKSLITEAFKKQEGRYKSVNT